MDGIQATPTTTVTGLFSTIAGDITADTVNSVISDLNLFRSHSSPLDHHWDHSTPPTTHSSPSMMEHRDPTTQGVSERSLQPSDQGSSSDSFPQSEPCGLSLYTGTPLNGMEEAVMSLHLTPPTSDPAGPHSSSIADGNSTGATSGVHSDSDCEMPARKKRAPVPNEKKDERYWERRKKNNIAAKRSREARRKKIDDELKQAQDAIQENQKLKQEIEVLKAEINSLRRLLKDANMTLSLWIRAKQTSEPNAQLPPMLRGPNVPFVNFPVSSNV